MTGPATKSRKRRLGWGMLVVLALVLVPAGAWVCRRVHDARLNALFAGPIEEVSDGRRGCYCGVSYDLSAYAAEPASDNDAGTPRPAPDNVPTPRSLDGATGATRIVRLTYPSAYREAWVPRALTITEPPDNALFPANLCPPFVEWSDAGNNLWQLTLSVPGTPLEWSALTDQPRLRIDERVWAELRRVALEREIVLRVKGIDRSGLWSKRRDGVHVSKPVRFAISSDAADNCVVYRLVSPPFINRKTPDIYVRDIREPEAKVFLRARREYCFNCHAFSTKAGTGGKLGLQVRYLGTRQYSPASYFAIYDMATRRAVKGQLPFETQMSTFMAWSADGTKMAFSANQQIIATAPVVYETQSAAQPSSDLAVYDVTHNRAGLLPGTCDPDLTETYPTWTPDGESIVYCVAPAKAHPSLVRFDLRVIPYSDGRGGTSTPVPDASSNGKSNYYPRFSPDGRWLAFVRSDAGFFITSSSDICIMSADLRGPARTLECNAPHAADSWYSWSSNSRWLVFASKRDDGVFARLYLTHIDERGHASPAVKLPVTELPLMSFNIPEFVAQPPPVVEQELYDEVRVERPAVSVGSP